MALKITIKLADDSEKEFTIDTTVELASGLELTPVQINALLGGISSINTVIQAKSWKSVEIEVE